MTVVASVVEKLLFTLYKIYCWFIFLYSTYFLDVLHSCSFSNLCILLLLLLLFLLLLQNYFAAVVTSLISYHWFIGSLFSNFTSVTLSCDSVWCFCIPFHCKRAWCCYNVHLLLISQFPPKHYSLFAKIYPFNMSSNYMFGIK